MEIEEIRGIIDKKAYEDQLEGFFLGLVSVALCQFSFGALILLYLSLIPLDTQSFLGAPLESVAYLDAWRKKVKEEQESTIRHQDQQLQQVFLAGTELHVCFPHQFWHAWHMHVVIICHWHRGFPRLTMDFHSLAIFGITMVLWVHLFVFLVGSYVSFNLG